MKIKVLAAADLHQSRNHYEAVAAGARDHQVQVVAMIGDFIGLRPESGILDILSVPQAARFLGYATMDGDTSGGLSPLAGIDKAWLRCWLQWLETQGPEGLNPIPALAAVNRQAPTAELRPAGCKQTDEEDLMPYDVLDAIERTAIRDK